MMSWWSVIGFRFVFDFHTAGGFKGDVAVFFLLVDVTCILGLIISVWKIDHYNRNVLPRLRWNWEHTYVCRRCGRTLLILS